MALQIHGCSDGVTQGPCGTGREDNLGRLKIIKTVELSMEQELRASAWVLAHTGAGEELLQGLNYFYKFLGEKKHGTLCKLCEVRRSGWGGRQWTDH